MYALLDVGVGRGAQGILAQILAIVLVGRENHRPVFRQHEQKILILCAGGLGVGQRLVHADDHPRAFTHIGQVGLYPRQGVGGQAGGVLAAVGDKHVVEHEIVHPALVK